MSKSRTFLLIVCVLSLAMVGYRLASFVESRIPPFKAGECFGIPKNPFLTVKVLDNHILSGYSDVEVNFLLSNEKAKVSFDELRLTPTKKVDCQ